MLSEILAFQPLDSPQDGADDFDPQDYVDALTRVVPEPQLDPDDFDLLEFALLSVDRLDLER